MVAKMMHQTKVTILLSLNAVVILIVGIMIYSAINLNGGIEEFRVVSERSDIIAANLEQFTLLTPAFDQLDAAVASSDDDKPSGSVGSLGTTTIPVTRPTHIEAPAAEEPSQNSGGKVPRGELWAETAMTIYQTASVDICVDSSISGLGEMYWQTSDPSVIKGFASQARTWLGYKNETCRYPVIAGTGTTTITAGTYDGTRYDKITVTVIAPPVEQWKRDVLNLVNQERAKNGLAALTWGTTCEAAANTRAREIMTSYSHTRPNGSSWSTTCPIPSTGGKSGENLNAGNAAVTPATVVASWMGSPDHRKNILDPDFKYLSVGFIFDQNSTHKTYWSQYFTTY